MGRKCSAPGCRSNYDNEKEYVTVFKFPSEPSRRSKWIHNLNRTDFNPSSTAVVCIKHFEERFIIREDSVKRDDGTTLTVPRKQLALSSEAYPTLFENLPTYLTKKVPPERKDPEKRREELSSSNLPDTTNDQLTEENSIQEKLQNHAVHLSVPLSSQTVSSNSSHPSSSLPASENWPGQYDFSVSFHSQTKDTKGVTWTYSEIKDKLYVGKDVPCPINFAVNTVMPAGNVTIRAMALYSSPEQVSEIVHRCVNHSMQEISNGRPEAEHLVRCESSTATYHTDAATGRHSVVVPFENPAVGQQYSTYIYKFACFGSCSGGPNRRPLMLIFTLESGNQVIGRRRLDVKICACPGRDRKNDEAQCMPTDVVPHSMPTKRKATNELVNLSEVMEFSRHVYLPPPKKSKSTPNEEGVYILDTEDKGCYDFLLHMKKFYDICKFMRTFPPDFIARAKHLPKNYPKTEG